jgi:hypothetical protein
VSLRAGNKADNSGKNICDKKEICVLIILFKVCIRELTLNYKQPAEFHKYLFVLYGFRYELRWDGTKYSVKVSDGTNEYKKDITDLGGIFPAHEAAYHPGMFVANQTISISEITRTFN